MAQLTATWLEQEPPLAAAGFRAASRIARRGLSSWPLSVFLGVLVAGGLTFWQSRARPVYEVSVTLRVSETAVEPSGSDLGLGALHAYVDDIVFTSARLKEVMSHHPELFPDLERDPSLSLMHFRDRLETTIADNDFIEDRAPGDPPRTARISVLFRAGDPEAAWNIAHELADLLIDSTRAGQRSVLERAEAAAALAVHRAETAVKDLSDATPVGQPNPALENARLELTNARRVYSDAQISLRAAMEHQTLRFDVVDQGRLPEPVNRAVTLTQGFLVTLFAAFGAAWLLAGALDPRVLDDEDLTSLGVPLLGRMPPLPLARDRSGEAGGPRV